MRKLYVLIFVFLPRILIAQSIVAAEDFENSLSVFTATGGMYYSGVSGSGDRPATSSFSCQNNFGFGISNGTATLLSGGINTLNYNNLQLEFRLSSFSIGSTANGADAGDFVKVEVSNDAGQNYYPTLQVNGNTNAWWGYVSGTGVAAAQYDGDNIPDQFSPTGGGSRSADGFSTLRISALPSVADLRIRITILNNALTERWVVDSFSLSGFTGTSTPVALKFTSVLPSSPTAGSPFSVQVQAIDASQQPVVLSTNTGIALSLNSGTGVLSGILSGTINSGSSSINLPGIVYSIPENGVIINAVTTSGASLSGLSSAINVRAAAFFIVLTE